MRDDYRKIRPDLQLQSTDGSKRKLADYIIDTSQTLEQTEAVVVDLISDQLNFQQNLPKALFGIICI